MTVSDRVRGLIDRYYGGKITPAAKAAGVPQRSLHRLYNAPVQPRADMLAKLAAHFGTSVEWLLGGRGDEPAGPQMQSDGAPAKGEAAPLLPQSQMERWEKLLESLELRPHVEHAWRQLPMTISNAINRFRVNYDRNPHITLTMVAAMGRELWAWTLFLEEWIAIDGREKVHRAMSQREHVNAARLGFNWYSVVLLNEKKSIASMVEGLANAHGLSESKAGTLRFAQSRKAGKRAALERS